MAGCSEGQRVSILLRTLNEEQNLPELLGAVRAQRCAAGIEWILVDSGSTDGTLDIARRFGMAHILTLPSTEFSYGRALNEAARHSTGEILVALSAHACPAHERWLAFLLSHFDVTQIGGVYGRQLPRPNAWPPVAVDYARCYGPESNIYESVADVFFSNANAAFRRTLWEQFPFDESLPACEDQAWAQRVVGAGYRIVYDARAAAYHSHNEGARRLYQRRERETRGWRQIAPSETASLKIFLSDWYDASRADIHYIIRNRNGWRWLLLSPGYRFFWALGRWYPGL